MTIVAWVACALLALLTGVVLSLVLELRRSRLRRTRPQPGAVVGKVPASHAPAGIDEEVWLKDQKHRILAKLRRDFPKLSGHNLDAAAAEILEKARSVLARTQ
jgi:hypothetical protein